MEVALLGRIGPRESASGIEARGTVRSGGRLCLSTHTVEFHLHWVFTRLGIPRDTSPGAGRPPSCGLVIVIGYRRKVWRVQSAKDVQEISGCASWSAGISTW